MTKSVKIHDSAIERFERTIQQDQDRLCQDFLRSLQERMEELNMSQSDVAYTLGKSRAYVSKLFTKGPNLTIKTMVELSHALDLKLKITTRRLWPNVPGITKQVPLRLDVIETISSSCSLIAKAYESRSGSMDHAGIWRRAIRKDVPAEIAKIS